jgi:uncharacterized protein
MRILIDIGHPAHVHYFRNFIRIMTDHGHDLHIVSRDKEVTHDLLKRYNIPFTSRGKGGKGFIGKLLYLFWADYKIVLEGIRFKPDVLLSFASTYAAHASFILRKPHIAFDDTEHSKFEIFLYRPFTSVILTPESFKRDFGAKHIRFKGFMELCYLHPKYFTPDTTILSKLDLIDNQNYVLLRFVSWKASHDSGEQGLTYNSKLELVERLHGQIKVFISSEGELPQELHQFRLPVSAEKLHDVLAFSKLYIGEGATTASECVMLGTPAIYVNSLTAGTLEDQERMGSLFSFRGPDGVYDKVMRLLNQEDLKAQYSLKKQDLLSKCIDVTAFMVWFIENFPVSCKIMKENPKYQEKFK